MEAERYFEYPFQRRPYWRQHLTAKSVGMCGICGTDGTGRCGGADFGAVFFVRGISI